MNKLPARRYPTVFKFEADFVDRLCQVLPRHLSTQCTCWRLMRETGVGGNITDIAIVQSNKGALPSLPLMSVRDCVILAKLRQDGPTRIDLLERACGIARGGLRTNALRTLEKSGLVQCSHGGRVSRRGVGTGIRIVAVEAKLLKWRQALAQACAYTAYADESYVALPNGYAHRAIEHSGEFRRVGIGLMVLGRSKIDIAVKAVKQQSHDWRREFVLSRVLNQFTQTQRNAG